MIGSKEGRIPSQDGRNGRVSPEFLVEKLSNQVSVPPLRVGKTGIKGEVPFVKITGLEILGFRCINRKIEEGQV
jgi:hypothetical protein